MLDLIFDNRSYDPAIVYQLGNVVSTYSGMYTKGNTAVASSMENISSSAQNAADKFIDSFTAMRQ